MTKVTYSPDFPEGKEEQLTAEEISQNETDLANDEAKATADAEAKQAKEDLKASAKAKLIAGEPLTEAEADTLVI